MKAADVTVEPDGKGYTLRAQNARAHQWMDDHLHLRWTNGVMRLKPLHLQAVLAMLRCAGFEIAYPAEFAQTGKTTRFDVGSAAGADNAWPGRMGPRSGEVWQQGRKSKRRRRLKLA